MFNWFKKQMNLSNQELFLKEIMSLIIQQETHEALEFFRYENQKMFDPHAKFKDLSTTIYWNDN